MKKLFNHLFFGWLASSKAQPTRLSEVNFCSPRRVFGHPKLIRPKNSKILIDFRPKTSDKIAKNYFISPPKAVFELNQKCLLRFYTCIELPLPTLQSGATNALIFRKNCLTKKLFNYLQFRFRPEKVFFFSKTLGKLVPPKPSFGPQKNYSLICFLVVLQTARTTKTPPKTPRPGRPGGWRGVGGGI